MITNATGLPATDQTPATLKPWEQALELLHDPAQSGDVLLKLWSGDAFGKEPWQLVKSAMLSAVKDYEYNLYPGTPEEKGYKADMFIAQADFLQALSIDTMPLNFREACLLYSFYLDHEKKGERIDLKRYPVESNNIINAIMNEAGISEDSQRGLVQLFFTHLYYTGQQQGQVMWLYPSLYTKAVAAQKGPLDTMVDMAGNIIKAGDALVTGIEWVTVAVLAALIVVLYKLAQNTKTQVVL